MTTPVYLTREYYRDNRPAQPSWPAQDPPPEVLSTAPRPADAPEEPRAVKTLQRALQAAGWAVRVGYSRGPERAVKVGTYKITETFGVWTDAHASQGWRVTAVYARTVGSKSWAWRISIRRPGRVIAPGLGVAFTHCTITDLLDFATVRGDVLPSWFAAIKKREEQKKAKARVEALGRSATKPREGQS